ncbi:MAG: sodium:proton antiporter [Chloroflexi bacterium HGW-Chloroflexi-5]|jgi:Kef-type K+ transport system membrane component KefB|nr:MAG: sodium:proton antiporter [Chloroflexi bacterium HGW-Chloroflexi-5]PKP09828.1 MAG: sodium:proton antiporter [Bacteroidetes bacterium HGW-Bacteroidetes-4]
MNDFFKDFFHHFELPFTNPVLVFSLILFIILFVPILFRRINVPGIIGLIISGIIIGPLGFNVLEKNSAVDLFSTIGLLYIMFMAGLELELNEFKRVRNQSVVFGFFTFFIPLIIGFPICYYLLGYELNASLLITSMFATHTLVAYPIISKLGIAKNRVVAVTVGGTIITDTIVLILLAVIMGNSQGKLNPEFWIILGSTLVAFTFIMFAVIPKITRWFFKKLESEKHAHYVFVLSVVFFSAFLAELSGLEPIIGAFIAGLALNQLIPQSSPLMNRIEFIGNSIFIPFFLISVGMLIDVRVIFSGPATLLIGLVLTLSALLSKWLAAFITQKIYKYSRMQRQLIFGLSSARVAATLAIILVGYNAGILDKNILNIAIIIILITTIFSSVITEKAAKQILLADNASDESQVQQPLQEHMLLPIANLMNIEKLIEFALLIKQHKSVNPVTVLSVVPNNTQAEANLIEARKRLEEFKAHGAATETSINTVATIDYNPSSAIGRISKEIMADIIILGWPKKANILERLIGEKIYAIVNSVDKNFFVCSLDAPLINQKRIVVITTPKAELEYGFETWLHKVVKLSKELSIPLVHFGSKITHEAIREVTQRNKLHATFSFNTFDDWENFHLLADYIKADDLLILVSARKKSLSYVHHFDHIPNRIDKRLMNNDIIVVYPQQFNHRNNETEIALSETLLTNYEK